MAPRALVAAFAPPAAGTPAARRAAALPAVGARSPSPAAGCRRRPLAAAARQATTPAPSHMRVAGEGPSDSGSRVTAARPVPPPAAAAAVGGSVAALFVAALLFGGVLAAAPDVAAAAAAAAPSATTDAPAAATAPAAGRPVWAPPADGGGSYGLRKGSLQQCVGDASCLSSTSVRNPSKFAPPWTWQSATGDEAVAWASLKALLARLEEAGGQGAPRVVAVDDAKRYVRSEWPGFPKGVVDVVEFLFVPGDGIVTFRSCSQEVRYIYPFQAPLGDLGANLDHLTRVRTALDWTELSGYTIF